MLGAPLETITLLHHAEAIADVPNKRLVTFRVPVAEHGRVEERTFTDIDTSAGAFPYEELALSGGRVRGDRTSGAGGRHRRSRSRRRGGQPALRRRRAHRVRGLVDRKSLRPRPGRPDRRRRRLSCARMRALVTGGAGFIGSHLVDALIARGDRVLVLDDLSSGRRENLAGALDSGVELLEASVTDDDAVAAAFERARPQVVFHLAAQIDVRRSVADPSFDLDVNVGGTIRLLEGARQAGVERFVFASTGGRSTARARAATSRSPRARTAGPTLRTVSRSTPPRAISTSIGASTGSRRPRCGSQRLRPTPGPARRGRRGRDLLQRPARRPPPASLRRRRADARLRLFRRRRRRLRHRGRPRRRGPVQHRHGRRDQRGRPRAPDRIGVRGGVRPRDGAAAAGRGAADLDRPLARRPRPGLERRARPRPRPRDHDRLVSS